MKIRIIDAFILVLLLVFTVIFYAGAIPGHSFDYDEADYMVAAKKGFYENYMDSSSLPILEFFSIGMTRGLNNERASLSEIIRSSGDVAFFRHYHGPLSFYPLILWHRLVGDSEYLLRWSSLLLALMTLAVTYMGCLYIGRDEGRVAAYVAGILLISSHPNMITATEISTHALFTFLTLVALFLTAIWFQTGEIRYWYLAVAVVALTFATTEYAAFLFLTLIFCAFFERRKLFENRSPGKVMLWSALLFIGVLFAVWPGGVLKLSLLRNYLFAAYLVVVREGEYGGQNLWDIWTRRFFFSPLTYTLVLTTAAIALCRIKQYRLLFPLLVYVLLLLPVTLLVTTAHDRYISTLVPPLFVVSGLLIASMFRSYGAYIKAGTVGILTVLILSQTPYTLASPQKTETQPTHLDRVIRYFQLHPEMGKRILTDWSLRPSLTYYFPETVFSSYPANTKSPGSIVAKLRSTSYDGLFYKGSDERELESRLRKHFIVRPAVITESPRFKVVFFELNSTLSSQAK